MDLLEARNMAFGTLVSRSKFYKNPKVVSLVKDLREAGVIDKFYDDHFTPGVIKRTEYIQNSFNQEFMVNPNSSVLTLGCGFGSYFYDTKHNPNINWMNTDLQSVTNIRFTHWGESYEGTSPVLRTLDLTSEDAMPFLRMMVDKVDIMLAEGVLMYIPKERAKEILKLPWKNMVFDVLGSNRKIPLGKNHLWQYEYNEWNYNIINRSNFDGAEKDSWVYTVKRIK